VQVCTAYQRLISEQDYDGVGALATGVNPSGDTAADTRPVGRIEDKPVIGAVSRRNDRIAVVTDDQCKLSREGLLRGLKRMQHKWLAMQRLHELRCAKSLSGARREHAGMDDSIS